MIFERFLTHKLTLSSTGLFSHPIIAMSAVARPAWHHPLSPYRPWLCLRTTFTVNYISVKRIFDRLKDSFYETVHTGNVDEPSRSVHPWNPLWNSTNLIWPHLTVFWKISTSTSLANSINHKQSAENKQAKQLIAIQGMVFILLLDRNHLSEEIHQGLSN